MFAPVIIYAIVDNTIKSLNINVVLEAYEDYSNRTQSY